MTPEELDRVLDRQRHNHGASSALYLIALVVIAVVLLFVYGDP